MISIAKQWSILSSAFYGEEFKDELADFLKQYNVQEVLECGCGDGNILQGLAERGLSGLGIDSDREMIFLTLKNHRHPRIEYRLMNWLDICALRNKYSAVLCRGGSIMYATNWGKRDSFNHYVVRKSIGKSVNEMMERVEDGGLLYIDTVSQTEIDNKGGEFRIELGNICLDVNIRHDWNTMTRYVTGKGYINGHEVTGTSRSYLLSPDELEDMIKRLYPEKVWRPNIFGERNYTVICAIK